MAEQEVEHLQLQMEADGVILVEHYHSLGAEIHYSNTFNNAYMEYSVDITYVAYDGASVSFATN